MKEIEVKLALENIYGGDGFERPHTVEQVCLERSKEKITVRHDIGVPVKKERSEKQIEKKEVAVKTFKRAEDGTPLYPLGGTHGKLWGVLREAGYDMYQAGEQGNKVTTDRILRVTQIRPQWVPLETNGAEVEIAEEPQMLSGRQNSMIQMYFDVVPECEATLTMRFPEVYEDVIMKYLERAQSISFGNRRKGMMTILEINECD